MKKSLVLMAMAGVALASCVNDVADVAQNQEQKKVKIAFDTPVLYNNAESRAKVFGEISAETVDGAYSYPNNEDFQIYAVAYSEATFPGWRNTDEYLFHDTSITYAGTGIDGWAPLTKDDPLTDENEGGQYYYWPTGKRMAFAACSPANLDLPVKSASNEDGVERTYGADGLTIANFSIPVHPEGKYYDLLFSKRTVDRTAANMSHGADYYSGIAIQFQHALSSIRFSIMNKTLVPVKLLGIKLWGVKYKADFKENLTEDNSNKGKYVIAKYDEDGDLTNDGNVAPAWSNYKDDLILDSAPYVGFDGEISFPYPNAGYVSNITKAENDGDACHQLLLLPQVLTNEVKVRVDYSVGGQKTYKIVGLNGLLTDEDNPETVEVEPGRAINKWEIGRRYTYRLVYSSSTAEKDMIYFAPSTEGWDDEHIVVVPL